MKLALGTAQFGLDYGVANKDGQVPLEEAERILCSAKSAGIVTLDTAIAYGTSEEVLGKIGVSDFQIVTKLPAIETDSGNVKASVHQQIEGSLRRLRVDKVYALLLHRPAQLLGNGGEQLYDALIGLKREGLVTKIGVSVYQPEELSVLTAFTDLGIVQAPFNLIDQRMLTSGCMDKLAANGVELHVRSAFMQGLLLMPPAERPPYFRRWDPLWRAWQQWLEAEKMTPVEACLRYVNSFSAISKIVIGVNTAAQLEEIMGKMDGGELSDLPSALRIDDIDLLNPTKWNMG